MPSVTWFSAKNAAGSMRFPARSGRSSTVSRRAGSNVAARGVHACLRVFMGSADPLEYTHPENAGDDQPLPGDCRRPRP